MSALRFDIFDRRIHFFCPDAEVARLVVTNWSGLSAEDGAFASVALDYSILRAESFDGFDIRRNGQLLTHVLDASDLLFCIEKDVTIELQKLRHDLLFLHAAALDLEGRAALLVAASGSGKSTTAWALLHHGFGYLSDELAPVDLGSMRVRPYPHALCLKSDPPDPYALPATTLRTSRTLHVPTTSMPTEPVTTPRPIEAIFFLNPHPSALAPSARPISGAEAATRLYVNALNLLAHPAAGLDAAISIASHARCFELNRSDLTSMSRAIRDAVSASPAA